MALSALGQLQATAVRDLDLEEANRQVVLRFVNALERRELDEAMECIGDGYRQHNPDVADGKDGVRAFFADLMKRFPDMGGTVLRTSVEHDMVWAHCHMRLWAEDPGTMFVDIFRVRDGKLVEHWDVMQPVPAASANGNSMF